MQLRVEVARSFGDARAAAAAWGRVAWEREEAELDYFLARLRARPTRSGRSPSSSCATSEPVAALAARVESRRLPTTVGYRVVYAPRVRLLHVVQGGMVAAGPAGARDALVAALRAELAARRASTPSASRRCRSTPSSRRPRDARRAARSGSRFDATVDAPAARRCPRPFEEFVASRSSNTRWRIRRDAEPARRRARRPLDGRDRPRAVRARPARPRRRPRRALDLPAGARRRLRRHAGAAQARRASALEHGWMRALPALPRRRADRVLALLALRRHDADPAPTGFDNAYAEHRVGIYLLMRVDRGRHAPTPRSACSTSAPATPPTSSSSSSESGRSGTRRLRADASAGCRMNAIRTAIVGVGAARPARARRGRAHRPRADAAGAGRASALVSPADEGSLTVNVRACSAPKIVAQCRPRPPLRSAARRHGHDPVRPPRRPRRRQRRLRRPGDHLRAARGAARGRDRRRRLRQGPRRSTGSSSHYPGQPRSSGSSSTPRSARHRETAAPPRAGEDALRRRDRAAAGRRDALLPLQPLRRVGDAPLQRRR